MGYLLRNVGGCMLPLLLLGCGNHNHAEKVTAANILKIDIGMSENQVIDYLGEPVRKYRGGSQSYTFQYTERGFYHYPMVWVHFDTSGVNQVYVKYYCILDDKGIYALTKGDGCEKEQWGENDLAEVFE